MSTITKEQAKDLRNAFECWQQDYDPVEDKEQYDMFGLGMVAMDALLASLEAEPVITVGDDGGDALAYRRLIQTFAPGTKLYTAPPAPENAEPVAWLWSHRKHPSEVTLVRPEDDERTEGANWSGWSCQALYAAPTAPVSVPDYPETLPCPVVLEPGLRFGKGVNTRTMLGALQRRAEYHAELEAMTPEQRAEHDAGMKDFAAMLQGADGNSLVIPDGWVVCSERMPDDEEDVLCFGQYGDNDIDEERYQFMGWLSRKGIKRVWRVSDGDSQNRRARVTHWMPLPAAPQREAKNV